MKSISYQDYLIKTLKDPEEAAGYLNAALRNVVQAQGGVNKLSQSTHKSRTSLYKALSEKGNPYLKSIRDLLSALGMHLAIIADQK